MSAGAPGLVGVVGLGHMGSVLAANLAAGGFDVVGFDPSPAVDVPGTIRRAGTLAEVAGTAPVVLLSLPDARAVTAVCEALVEAPGSVVRDIVDASTIGPACATAMETQCATRGVRYSDAPVSGGVRGARNRRITVMFAGSGDAFACVKAALDAVSGNVVQVGDRAGLGQALKLANNFLSATCLAATSEAVSFGTSLGLDMQLMLDVLNKSSGRSAATEDKFVNEVVTERYSAGFSNTLMRKDVALYRDAVADAGTCAEIGRLTAAIWDRFGTEEPDVDFTRIYPYVNDRRERGSDARRS